MTNTSASPANENDSTETNSGDHNKTSDGAVSDDDDQTTPDSPQETRPQPQGTTSRQICVTKDSSACGYSGEYSDIGYTFNDTEKTHVQYLEYSSNLSASSNLYNEQVNNRDVENVMSSFPDLNNNDPDFASLEAEVISTGANGRDRRLQPINCGLPVTFRKSTQDTRSNPETFYQMEASGGTDVAHPNNYSADVPIGSQYQHDTKFDKDIKNKNKPCSRNIDTLNVMAKDWVSKVQFVNCEVGCQTENHQNSNQKEKSNTECFDSCSQDQPNSQLLELDVNIRTSSLEATDQESHTPRLNTDCVCNVCLRSSKEDYLQPRRREDLSQTQSHVSWTTFINGKIKSTDTFPDIFKDYEWYDDTGVISELSPNTSDNDGDDEKSTDSNMSDEEKSSSDERVEKMAAREQVKSSEASSSTVKLPNDDRLQTTKKTATQPGPAIDTQAAVCTMSSVQPSTHNSLGSGDVRDPDVIHTPFFMSPITSKEIHRMSYAAALKRHSSTSRLYAEPEIARSESAVISSDEGANQNQSEVPSTSASTDNQSAVTSSSSVTATGNQNTTQTASDSAGQPTVHTLYRGVDTERPTEGGNKLDPNPPDEASNEMKQMAQTPGVVVANRTTPPTTDTGDSHVNAANKDVTTSPTSSHVPHSSSHTANSHRMDHKHYDEVCSSRQTPDGHSFRNQAAMKATSTAASIENRFEFMQRSDPAPSHGAVSDPQSVANMPGRAASVSPTENQLPLQAFHRQSTNDHRQWGNHRGRRRSYRGASSYRQPVLPTAYASSRAVYTSSAGSNTQNRTGYCPRGVGRSIRGVPRNKQFAPLTPIDETSTGGQTIPHTSSIATIASHSAVYTTSGTATNNSQTGEYSAVAAAAPSSQIAVNLLPAESQPLKQIPSNKNQARTQSSNSEVFVIDASTHSTDTLVSVPSQALTHIPNTAVSISSHALTHSSNTEVSVTNQAPTQSLSTGAHPRPHAAVLTSSGAFEKQTKVNAPSGRGNMASRVSTYNPSGGQSIQSQPRAHTSTFTSYAPTQILSTGVHRNNTNTPSVRIGIERNGMTYYYQPGDPSIQNQPRAPRANFQNQPLVYKPYSSASIPIQADVQVQYVTPTPRHEQIPVHHFHQSPAPNWPGQYGYYNGAAFIPQLPVIPQLPPGTIQRQGATHDGYEVRYMTNGNGVNIPYATIPPGFQEAMAQSLYGTQLLAYPTAVQNNQTGIHPPPNVTLAGIQTGVCSLPSVTQTAVYSSHSVTKTAVYSSPSVTQATVYSSPNVTQTAIYSSPSVTQATAYSSHSVTQTAVYSSLSVTRTAVYSSPSITQTEVRTVVTGSSIEQAAAAEHVAHVISIAASTCNSETQTSPTITGKKKTHTISTQTDDMTIEASQSNEAAITGQNEVQSPFCSAANIHSLSSVRPTGSQASVYATPGGTVIASPTNIYRSSNETSIQNQTVAHEPSNAIPTTQAVFSSTTDAILSNDIVIDTSSRTETETVSSLTDQTNETSMKTNGTVMTQCTSAGLVTQTNSYNKPSVVFTGNPIVFFTPPDIDKLHIYMQQQPVSNNGAIILPMGANESLSSASCTEAPESESVSHTASDAPDNTYQSGVCDSSIGEANENVANVETSSCTPVNPNQVHYISLGEATQRQVVGTISNLHFGGHTVEAVNRDVTNKRTSTYVCDSVNQNPVQNPSYGTAIQNPSDGTAVQNPSDGTAVQNPSHGTAVQNPSHGTAVQNPSHGTAVQNPSHGTAVQNLSHGTAVQNLSHGTAVHNPSHGTAVQNLSHGTAVQNLSHGTAVQNLSHGTAVQNPSDGTAVQNPSDGTAVQSQAEGTAVQSQAEGTAVQSQAEGTAVQSQAEGTAVQSQAEGTAVQSQAEGTAVQSQAEGTAVQSQAEGTAVQSQAEGTAVQSQAEGTAVQSQAEGTAVQSQAEGTSSPGSQRTKTKVSRSYKVAALTAIEINPSNTTSVAPKPGLPTRTSTVGDVGNLGTTEEPSGQPQSHVASPNQMPNRHRRKNLRKRKVMAKSINRQNNRAESDPQQTLLEIRKAIAESPDAPVSTVIPKGVPHRENQWQVVEAKRGLWKSSDLKAPASNTTNERRPPPFRRHPNSSRRLANKQSWQTQTRPQNNARQNRFNKRPSRLPAVPENETVQVKSQTAPRNELISPIQSGPKQSGAEQGENEPAHCVESGLKKSKARMAEENVPVNLIESGHGKSLQEQAENNAGLHSTKSGSTAPSASQTEDNGTVYFGESEQNGDNAAVCSIDASNNICVESEKFYQSKDSSSTDSWTEQSEEYFSSAESELRKSWEEQTKSNESTDLASSGESKQNESFHSADSEQVQDNVFIDSAETKQTEDNEPVCSVDSDNENATAPLKESIADDAKRLSPGLKQSTPCSESLNLAQPDILESSEDQTQPPTEPRKKPAHSRDTEQRVNCDNLKAKTEPPKQDNVIKNKGNGTAGNSTTVNYSFLTKSQKKRMKKKKKLLSNSSITATEKDNGSLKASENEEKGEGQGASVNQMPEDQASAGVMDISSEQQKLKSNNYPPQESQNSSSIDMVGNRREQLNHQEIHTGNDQEKEDSRNQENRKGKDSESQKKKKNNTGDKTMEDGVGNATKQNQKQSKTSTKKELKNEDKANNNIATTPGQSKSTEKDNCDNNETVSHNSTTTKNGKNKTGKQSMGQIKAEPDENEKSLIQNLVCTHGNGVFIGGKKGKSKSQNSENVNLEILLKDIEEKISKPCSKCLKEAEEKARVEEAKKKLEADKMMNRINPFDSEEEAEVDYDVLAAGLPEFSLVIEGCPIMTTYMLPWAYLFKDKLLGYDVTANRIPKTSEGIKERQKHNRKYRSFAESAIHFMNRNQPFGYVLRFMRFLPGGTKYFSRILTDSREQVERAFGVELPSFVDKKNVTTKTVSTTDLVPHGAPGQENLESLSDVHFKNEPLSPVIIPSPEGHQNITQSSENTELLTKSTRQKEISGNGYAVQDTTTQQDVPEETITDLDSNKSKTGLPCPKDEPEITESTNNSRIAKTDSKTDSSSDLMEMNEIRNNIILLGLPEIIINDFEKDSNKTTCGSSKRDLNITESIDSPRKFEEATRTELIESNTYEANELRNNITQLTLPEVIITDLDDDASRASKSGHNGELSLTESLDQSQMTEMTTNTALRKSNTQEANEIKNNITEPALPEIVITDFGTDTGGAINSSISELNIMEQLDNSRMSEVAANTALMESNAKEANEIRDNITQLEIVITDFATGTSRIKLGDFISDLNITESPDYSGMSEEATNGAERETNSQERNEMRNDISQLALPEIVITDFDTDTSRTMRSGPDGDLNITESPDYPGMSEKATNGADRESNSQERNEMRNDITQLALPQIVITDFDTDASRTIRSGPDGDLNITESTDYSGMSEEATNRACRESNSQERNEIRNDITQLALPEIVITNFDTDTSRTIRNDPNEELNTRKSLDNPRVSETHTSSHLRESNAQGANELRNKITQLALPEIVITNFDTDTSRTTIHSDVSGIPETGTNIDFSESNNDTEISIKRTILPVAEIVTDLDANTSNVLIPSPDRELNTAESHGTDVEQDTRIKETDDGKDDTLFGDDTADKENIVITEYTANGDDKATHTVGKASSTRTEATAGDENAPKYIPANNMDTESIVCQLEAACTKDNASCSDGNDIRYTYSVHRRPSAMTEWVGATETTAITLASGPIPSAEVDGACGSQFTNTVEDPSMTELIAYSSESDSSDYSDFSDNNLYPTAAWNLNETGASSYYTATQPMRPTSSDIPESYTASENKQASNKFSRPVTSLPIIQITPPTDEDLQESVIIDFNNEPSSLLIPTKPQMQNTPSRQSEEQDSLSTLCNAELPPSYDVVSSEESTPVSPRPRSNSQETSPNEDEEQDSFQTATAESDDHDSSSTDFSEERPPSYDEVCSPVPDTGSNIVKLDGSVPENGSNVVRVDGSVPENGSNVVRVDGSVPENGSNVVQVDGSVPENGSNVVQVDGSVPENGSNVVRVDGSVPENGSNVVQVGGSEPENGSNVVRVDDSVPENGSNVVRVDGSVPENGSNVVQVDGSEPENGSNVVRVDDSVPENGSNVVRVDGSVPENGSNVVQVDGSVPENGSNVVRVDDSVPENGSNVVRVDGSVPENGSNVVEVDGSVPENGSNVVRVDGSVPENGSDIANRDVLNELPYSQVCHGGARRKTHIAVKLTEEKPKLEGSQKKKNVKPQEFRIQQFGRDYTGEDFSYLFLDFNTKYGIDEDISTTEEPGQIMENDNMPPPLTLPPLFGRKESIVLSTKTQDENEIQKLKSFGEAFGWSKISPEQSTDFRASSSGLNGRSKRKRDAARSLLTGFNTRATNNEGSHGLSTQTQLFERVQPPEEKDEGVSEDKRGNQIGQKNPEISSDLITKQENEVANETEIMPYQRAEPNVATGTQPVASTVSQELKDGKQPPLDHQADQKNISETIYINAKNIKDLPKNDDSEQEENRESVPFKKIQRNQGTGWTLFGDKCPMPIKKKGCTDAGLVDNEKIYKTPQIWSSAEFCATCLDYAMFDDENCCLSCIEGVTLQSWLMKIDHLETSSSEEEHAEAERQRGDGRKKKKKRKPKKKNNNNNGNGNAEKVDGADTELNLKEFEEPKQGDGRKSKEPTQGAVNEERVITPENKNPRPVFSSNGASGNESENMSEVGAQGGKSNGATSLPNLRILQVMHGKTWEQAQPAGAFAIKQPVQDGQEPPLRNRPRIGHGLLRCMSCKKRDNLTLCSTCEAISYCSQSCVDEDYINHWVECKFRATWNEAETSIPHWLNRFIIHEGLRLITRLRHVPDLFQYYLGAKRALLVKAGAFFETTEPARFAIYIQDSIANVMPLLFFIDTDEYQERGKQSPSQLKTLLFPGRFIVITYPVWTTFDNLTDGLRLDDLRNLFFLSDNLKAEKLNEQDEYMLIHRLNWQV